MTRWLVTLLLSFTLAPNADSAELEKIMVPVIGNSSGAFGAQWSVEMWVRNDGELPMVAYPLAIRCSSPSRCGVLPVMHLGPNETLSWRYLGSANQILSPGFVPLTAPDAGALLYVERDRLDDFRVALHVRDVSKIESNLGVEVPIVRETDFRTERFSLPSIGVSSRYRYALRVYDPDNLEGASVSVRIFQSGDAGAEYLLSESVYALTDFGITTNCEDAVCPWPSMSYAPSILYLPLDLTSVRSPSVRVEIEPASSGLRFWAMVSATNNASHLVTIYSPD